MTDIAACTGIIGIMGLSSIVLLILHVLLDVDISWLLVLAPVLLVGLFIAIGLILGIIDLIKGK